MNVPREEVSERLLSLFLPLQCAAGGPPTQIQPFVTVSRILPPTPNIGPDVQPALYLLELDENDDQGTWGAERYLLKYRLLCMGWVADVSSTIPGSVINPLIDAFDIALRTRFGCQPLNVDPTTGWVVPANPLFSGAGETIQTLGEIVTNAYLNGPIKKATGHIGQQNWAVAQINVVTGE